MKKSSDWSVIFEVILKGNRSTQDMPVNRIGAIRADSSGSEENRLTPSKPRWLEIIPTVKNGYF